MRALAGGFVYDDTVDIMRVDAVARPGGWREILFVSSARLYRPFKYLTYHVDHALAGWDARAFHLQSLLWHSLNCALLFGLLRRMTRASVPALAAALWFAVHPVHAETVAWISARGSLLALAGMLTALHAWLHLRARSSVAAALAFAAGTWAAFFSREDGLMLLPLLGWLALLDRRPTDPDAPGRTRRLAMAWGFAALLAAGYIALRFARFEGLDQGQRSGSLASLAWALPELPARYLAALVYPVVLTPDHAVTTPTGPSPAGFAAIALHLLLAGLALRPATPLPIRLGLAWFYLLLVPVLGLVPINQPYADRFLYTAAPGIALCIAACMEALPAGNRRNLAAALAFGWVIYLGLLAHRAWAYTPVWHSDRTLWAHALEHNPASFRAWNNLAVEANNAGRPREALRLAARALALRPGYPEALVTRGFALDRLGQSAGAEADYRAALHAAPDNPAWLTLLADLLRRSHRPEEARATYAAALRAHPGALDALWGAADLALDRGDTGHAAVLWSRILLYTPGDLTARANLDNYRRDTDEHGPTRTNTD